MHCRNLDEETGVEAMKGAAILGARPGLHNLLFYRIQDYDPRDSTSHNTLKLFDTKLANTYTFYYFSPKTIIIRENFSQELFQLFQLEWCIFKSSHAHTTINIKGWPLEHYNEVISELESIWLLKMSIWVWLSRSMQNSRDSSTWVLVNL